MAIINCPSCKRDTLWVDQSYVMTTHPGQYNATCPCGHRCRVFGTTVTGDSFFSPDVQEVLRYSRDRTNALNAAMQSLGVPPRVFTGEPLGLINYPERMTYCNIHALHRVDQGPCPLCHPSRLTIDPATMERNDLEITIGDNPHIPAGQITIENLQALRRQIEDYTASAQRHVALTGMRISDRELRDRILGESPEGFPPGTLRYDGEGREIGAEPVSRESVDRPEFDLNSLPLPLTHSNFQFTTRYLPVEELSRTPPFDSHTFGPGVFTCTACGATLRELTVFRHDSPSIRNGICHKDFRRTAIVRVLTFRRTIPDVGIMSFISTRNNQPIPVWQYTRHEAASLLNYLSFGTGCQNSTIQGLIQAYKDGVDNLPVLADAFEDMGFDDGEILMVLRDQFPVPQGNSSQLPNAAWRTLNPDDWRAEGLMRRQAETIERQVIQAPVDNIEWQTAGNIQIPHPDVAEWREADEEFVRRIRLNQTEPTADDDMDSDDDD